MWKPGWRDQVWQDLQKPWDVVVVGGGITGVGVLREAARLGCRALLVEARDFAAGTSSRSSKLVHGGLRYLKNAQVKVTLESVHEREQLLRDGRGLINRLGFLYAIQKGDALPGWVFGAGLVIYDLLAGQWAHRKYDALDMRELCPPLSAPGLVGGYRYFDAQTDDARLVMRVLHAALGEGAFALNYTRAVGLLRSAAGQACGIQVADMTPEGGGRTAEIQARLVVNAAGPWSDALRSELGKPPRLRALRGSHLVLPAGRLPLTRAVSYLHPRDGRPVFVIPWEGVTLVGTTDVDQGNQLPIDPRPSQDELAYLLQMVTHLFPAQEIGPADIQAVFSGIRAVVNTGKANPSKESREHVIWNEDGLLTVSGGKLTTYRLMARAALNEARRLLPALPAPHSSGRFLHGDVQAAQAALAALNPATALRLAGRYGEAALDLFQAARPPDLEYVPGTNCLWAELRWAARAEAVVHLDDLLLRRVRLGLLLPGGGLAELEQVRQVVQPELGWDDVRWAAEAGAYTRLWQQTYAPGDS